MQGSQCDGSFSEKLILRSSSRVLYEKKHECNRYPVMNFKDEKYALISCTCVLVLVPFKTKRLLRYHRDYYGNLVTVATWYVANEAVCQI